MVSDHYKYSSECEMQKQHLALEALKFSGISENLAELYSGVHFTACLLLPGSGIGHHKYKHNTFYSITAACRKEVEEGWIPFIILHGVCFLFLFVG